MPSRVFRAIWAMQNMYFYVPKGTRTIEYYTRTYSHPGGPHKIIGPNGKYMPALVGDK